MRDYLFYLAGGTLIQIFWNRPDVWQIALVIIQLRLVATTAGLFSKSLRDKDGFFITILLGGSGYFIDALLFGNNMIDFLNLFLGFSLLILFITLYYFLIYKPAFEISVFRRWWFPIEIPYRIKCIRRLFRNDYLLFTISLYTVWYIGFYRFIPTDELARYWYLHQIASDVQIGFFILIGLLIRGKDETTD